MVLLSSFDIRHENLLEPKSDLSQIVPESYSSVDDYVEEPGEHSGHSETER